MLKGKGLYILKRMEDLKKYIKSQLEFLKQERSRYEDDWRLVCRLLNHRVKEKASKISETPIYDVTPIDAIGTTCRGITGYLLSPSIRWFHFTTHGSNGEKSDTLYGANDWLEEAQTQMYSLYSNSRFYANTKTALEDCAIIGTSYEMVIDKSADNSVGFNVFNPFECYGSDDENGNPDTFYREYTLTVRQAYKRFGDSLPWEVRRMMEDGNPNAEITLVHAIFPREDYKEGLVPAKFKKFASVHYCQMGDEIIDESGYDEFPMAIHRWEKTEGCFYGTSLAVKNKAFIIALNDEQKTYHIATQFQASPILEVDQTNKGKYIYKAGAVNYVNPQAKPTQPIQMSLNLSYSQQYIMNLQAQVNRLLFADLFNILMRQERQRTAYEVQELKGEGLVLLSAIIGNMQIEKIVPLVERTFRIMLNGRMFPTPPPEELIEASAQGRIEIELDGPLAQMMKAYHQATGLEQGLGAIANVTQMFPNTLANFDEDQIARQYATSKGLPQSCIREVTDVEKIHAQQAQMAQQQAQQEQALQQSEVLKNLGYNASSVGELTNQGGVNGIQGI